MTLRDYFAAMAMQVVFEKQPGDDYSGDSDVQVAVACYQMADAMLIAREK